MKVARLVILDNWGKPLALSIENSPAPIALQNTLMCHFWTVHSLYFLEIFFSCNNSSTDNCHFRLHNMVPQNVFTGCLNVVLVPTSEMVKIFTY